MLWEWIGGWICFRGCGRTGRWKGVCHFVRVLKINATTALNKNPPHCDFVAIVPQLVVFKKQHSTHPNPRNNLKSPHQNDSAVWLGLSNDESTFVAIINRMIMVKAHHCRMLCTVRAYLTKNYIRICCRSCVLVHCIDIARSCIRGSTFLGW